MKLAEQLASSPLASICPKVHVWIEELDVALFRNAKRFVS